jgi:dephospho-CoA kinase
VVDADVVAREVVEIGQPVLKKIHDSFGDWVLSPNGSLNRRALREHIFQNPSARHQLEQITHLLFANLLFSNYRMRPALM